MAASPTGEFTGHSGSLAGWTANGWRFVTPRDGLLMFDRGNSAFRLYRDGWRRQIVPDAPVGGTTIDAEARATIALLVEKLMDAGVFATS